MAHTLFLNTFKLNGLDKHKNYLDQDFAMLFMDHNMELIHSTFWHSS